jgi:hypothetical protein
MAPPADRQAWFSIERWRAARDLRADIACIVAALAILALVSRLDPVVKPQGPAEPALSAIR